MKFRILLGALSISVLLPGCASTMGSATPSMSTATLSAGGQPIIYRPVTSAASQRVVTQYVPVAMPGQMMPIPKSTGSSNSGSSSQPTLPASTPPALTATAAVDAANQQATEVPNSSQFFNSMMTYDYMPGALYTVYTAPMKITDIALAPGEKLISEAAGDTLRWQIAQTYSGAGDTLTQHI